MRAGDDGNLLIEHERSIEKARLAAPKKMREHLRNARLYVEEQLAAESAAKAAEPAGETVRKGPRVASLEVKAAARRTPSRAASRSTACMS